MRNEIKSLTGLRGVAALWVVGFHLSISLPNPLLPPLLFAHGNIGVDIFFLLSGFILAHTHDGMKAPQWPEFFLKRIFRIYPLHIAIMLALAVKVLLIPPVDVSAVYYSWQTFPYVLSLAAIAFGFSIDHWNSPTWSLTAELACYLIFPAVLLLINRISRQWAILLFLCCLVADVASLTDVGHWSYVQPTDGLAAFARGAAGFFTGMFLWLALRSVHRFAAGMDCVAVTGLLICACSPLIMFAPIFIAVLIAALSFDRGLIATLLGWKPIWWLGQVSFSIYLLHMPMLNLLSHIAPALAAHMRVETARMIALVIMVSSILAASAVTYCLIEVPAIRLGRRIIPAYLVQKACQT